MQLFSIFFEFIIWIDDRNSWELIHLWAMRFVALQTRQRGEEGSVVEGGGEEGFGMYCAVDWPYQSVHCPWMEHWMLGLERDR